MVTWYVLCDPNLKGDLLVQWRNQWKQWGSKFRYWSGDSMIRSKYGFGQWGYVTTDKEFPMSSPGVHVMGWQWNEIWGTPTMWKEITTSPKFELWRYFIVRNWYGALMARWRNVMCLYFYELRMNHWKLNKWENQFKWQQYIKE